MADANSLTTIASIIAAFGMAMLFFCIQRELHMGSSGAVTGTVYLSPFQPRFYFRLLA